MELTIVACPCFSCFTYSIACRNAIVRFASKRVTCFWQANAINSYLLTFIDGSTKSARQKRGNRMHDHNLFAAVTPAFVNRSGRLRHTLRDHVVDAERGDVPFETRTSANTLAVNP